MSVPSQKWKTKQRKRAMLARAREMKKAKLDVSSLSSGNSNTEPTAGNSPMECTEPSQSSDEERPGHSDSENENPYHSGSSSDEFDEQTVFDDWVVGLPLHDRKMLSVMLCVTLQKRFKMTATASALEAAWISGFNEKTVRGYRKDFFDNKGSFKEEKRGKYKRLSLFNDENLRLKAAMWVRENAVRKGEANMTARSFCQWINNDLLPSSNLPANFPRSICVRTATKWLHRLGYRPQSHKKGAYVDGHERDDVVASRKEYLGMLKKLRDLHLPPPPVSDERAATPPTDAETRRKLVLIYHDESIFSTNEGQQWAWATGEEAIIQPKTKGAGIMVSDFIEQHSGYLRLSTEEAKGVNPTFPTTARVLLEYGAEKEGYWNSKRFMENVKDAAKIAKYKYPTDKHTIVFIFDQSSCHRAFAEDSLNAKVMNVKPGGAQPCMRDTYWPTPGHVQKLVDRNGIPKGMKKVLEERGINTSTLLADDMRIILQNHDDFRREKTIVEHFLDAEGVKGVFLPKFHCELNPIERVWGQAKVYTRIHTNFTFLRLRTIIDPGLDSVSTDLIRKYFRKGKEYELAYLDGKKAGKELEQAVKKFKSHRRIFFETQV